MKLLSYCILSYIFISTSRSSLFSNIKANVLSLIKDNGYDRRFGRYAVPRAQLQMKPRPLEKDIDEKAHFQIDPVLNSFRRHGRQKQRRSFEIDADEKTHFEEDHESSSINGRRAKISRRRGSSSEFESTSSSREFRDWKDEWKEKWIQKKYEAINSSYVPGDTVNMLAARPWGVACGDPNQHDMPWGTCMLPMECDAEYRIYRGDYLCGRTQYVCCAIQLTAYDMYQGFDLSFENSGLDTDSQEKKLKGSKEDQKKHRQLMRKKRKKARVHRKRVLERQIKKIQKEIKKIITNQERNATQMKKRKTRQLKRFYDMLKRQYHKDRNSVADMHEYKMIKIDEVLKQKLEQIRQMNHDFIKNTTFRDIIVNGTLNRQAARMLVEAYPELQNFVNTNMNLKRRSGGGKVQDYLDYDVEYGMLYF